MSGPTWNVALPADAGPPFDVFVNGATVVEGYDFTVDGRWLRFTRPLATRSPKLTMWGRALLAIGIGVYKDTRQDVVDIRYRSGGEVRHATRLPVVPPSGSGQTRTNGTSNAS